MSDESGNSPSPRAFCHATGFVYQGVGMVLALGACCWWSFSGRIQDEVRPGLQDSQAASAPAETTGHQYWAMAGVVLSLVGGLGIAVLGLGMQHDRVVSAVWAKWVTLAVAVYFWCYLGMAIFVLPGAISRIVMPLGMAALWTVLFLMAGVSVETLKRHPPDPRARQSEWTSRDEDELRRRSSPHSRDKTNP